MERQIQLLMDINSRKDIELLMVTFYAKVNLDEYLSPVFNDAAKINWDTHLPVICDFWETLLLDAGSYTNNAMAVHYSLNRRSPLTDIHFNRWLELFYETVDELFTGTLATTAKEKAKSIALLMQFKMKQENKGLDIEIKKHSS